MVSSSLAAHEAYLNGLLRVLIVRYFLSARRSLGFATVIN